LENSLIYSDDIIVFAPDVDTHIHRLEEVFYRLQTINLKLKLEKCTLFAERVKYLGHTAVRELKRMKGRYRPLRIGQRSPVPDATPRSALTVLASSLAGWQVWFKRTPVASMLCAPVSASQAPSENLIDRQVRSMKTLVVASSGGDRSQSIETLETPHLDNKIMELRCGK